jgi:hypothetical protein
MDRRCFIQINEQVTSDSESHTHPSDWKVPFVSSKLCYCAEIFALVSENDSIGVRNIDLSRILDMETNKELTLK